MKPWGWVLVVGMFLILVVGWWRAMPVQKFNYPELPNQERTLDKYTIANLGKRIYEGSKIEMGETVSETDKYQIKNFSYLSDERKVTGQANIPKGIANPPVIIMVRGYWPREAYKSGDGTRRLAAVLAGNGFMTLAPDGLGYGRSDNPSTDVFEERFQNYTSVLNLLASIDSKKVGIWGHSNGGQIALSVAEILNKPVPVVVWAPVTARFPYSILYFMNEAPDGGRALRKKLASFEKRYNGDDYSLTEHVDRLVGPVQIHQGTADPDVPVSWSRDVVKKTKNIRLFEYLGADHNLQPGENWGMAVERTLEFFRNYL